MSIKDLNFDAKVLVVDDYVVNLELAKDMLEMMDCEVDIANNGEEALTQYHENDYDLILLDIQMPTIDGYAVCKEIRSTEKKGEGKHTLVIALTANAMSGDREKCISAGVDDYIAKPLRANDLAIVLDKYLSKKC